MFNFISGSGLISVVQVFSALIFSALAIDFIGTKKVHVILNYKEKNHLIKKDVRCKVQIKFKWKNFVNQIKLG